jgi:hypothetical protein
MYANKVNKLCFILAINTTQCIKGVLKFLQHKLFLVGVDQEDMAGTKFFGYVSP